MKRPLLAAALAAALPLLAAPAALADGSFVDAHLTLPVLHFAADAGVGFGQFQATRIDAMGNPTLGSPRLGVGSSLEAGIGLPFVGELRARVGYRFDDVAVGAQADHFARLFDPVVNEPGASQWTNPELILRGTLFDLRVVEVGLETRAVLPFASGSSFAITPGVPVRVHVPGLLRIDAGLYFPVAPFDGGATFVLEAPVQAFFQVGDAFFGPLTGLRYVGDAPAPNPAIVAGVGGGYTLGGGRVDLKAQVYTDAVNDAAWSNHIGGGLGVGLRLP